MNTMRQGLTRTLLVVSFLLVVSSHSNAQCTVVNGDFETSTLTGWTNYFRSQNVGSWYNYTGVSSPITNHDIAAPPQGTRAAVTDHNAPTTHALYQDILVPAGRSTLSFYLAYNNTNGFFVTLNTLDWVNNQQARIDLIKTTTSDIESVAPVDVIAKLYQSQPGDTLSISPARQMFFDLSPFAGQTVRLRFGAAVGLSYFPIAVDVVCVSPTRTTFTQPTNTGSNVRNNFGEVKLYYPSVTAAGTTSVQQLDPTAQTGPPAGVTFTGPAWDISTTATATNPINVCVSMPGITDTNTFLHLRMLHKEGGVWVNLSSSKVDVAAKLVCGSVTSLSPFAVGISSGAPTAANPQVSGTILDNNGSPVEGAAVRMNGSQNRLTVTDSAGFYHFDDVKADGVYTVTPSRANFDFTPSQKSFTAQGQNTDAAFTAAATNSGTNPLDTTEYFVRQQYVDFLGREPDEAGFNFWVNNIASCGADSQCRAGKRADTSAAFFLSTEFQQTGYLVYRMYQSAYGDMPGGPVPVSLGDFKPDSQAISNGVVVLQSGWEAKLEANKQAFALEFVQRARFGSAYPDSLTPDQFVDALFANAGVAPSSGDRAAAISEFGTAANSADALARSRALRKVAENSTLAQQEFNQAFVLMQYFGYLRRDPNTAPDADFSGYNFWLNKLDSFDGNYGNAQMVEAFLLAGEYRGRFPR